MNKKLIASVTFILYLFTCSFTVYADNRLSVERENPAVVTQGDAIEFNGIVDYSTNTNVSVTYSVLNTSGSTVIPNTLITSFQNEGYPIYFESSFNIPSNLTGQGDYTVRVSLRNGGINGTVVTSKTFNFFLNHPRRPKEPTINRTLNGTTATVTIANHPDTRISANSFQYRFDNSIGWINYSGPFQINSNRYVYARACRNGFCSKVNDVFVNGISPTPHSPSATVVDSVVSISQEYETIFLVNFRRGAGSTLPLPSGSFP